MDNLTDEERALAWSASWHPSFDGKAIVNRDFTFRSANPQFCKLLGVTPAELVGNTFQDITPIGIRELDEKNARLLIDGKADFYVLPKKYQFAGGRTVSVVLLATRAPSSELGEFQFFLSRIMLDEDGELVSGEDLIDQRQKNPPSGSDVSFPVLTGRAADFWMKYGKFLITIGTILGTAALLVYNALKGDF